MIASAEKARLSVRARGAEILAQVDTQKAYADILLDRALKNGALEERDRALLTEIVYGTLRWRGKIDAELAKYLYRALSGTDARVRNLLRLTCYQLFFLDRVPDYAAVSEALTTLAIRDRQTSNPTITIRSARSGTSAGSVAEG